jgi:hypothetical protein
MNTIFKGNLESLCYCLEIGIALLGKVQIKFEIFFFSALLDCMVLPLQDKMEEWKKSVALLVKTVVSNFKFFCLLTGLNAVAVHLFNSSKI